MRARVKVRVGRRGATCAASASSSAAAEKSSGYIHCASLGNSLGTWIGLGDRVRGQG